MLETLNFHSLLLLYCSRKVSVFATKKKKKLFQAFWADFDGFHTKTYIFSSFFSTLHSTNKTNNQQNASKWGISWMCEKHTDSNYKSYNTNRDPLAKQKKERNKHSMFVVVTVTSLNLVTVHVYKKTSIPLQTETPALFCLLYIHPHLRLLTTWLFFKVPSSKAKMSFTTSTTSQLTHTR